MHRKARSTIVPLLFVMTFCASCSREATIPSGHAIIEGTTGTFHDQMALFQITEDEYMKCSAAYRTALSHPRKVAPGFWFQYFELSTDGYSPGLNVEKGRFKAAVPKGFYMMAVPEKGYGTFLPVHVEGDMHINYDVEAAKMSVDI